MPDKISENIRQEMEKLVEALNDHGYRYYVLDSPVVSAE
jgi:NAD-dependent DNA ligase